MLRIAIWRIFFGFWILLVFWGTVEAGEDPMAAARVSKVKPGTPAFDFALRDMQGRTIQLADFRGKIVLLNFWATW